MSKKLSSATPKKDFSSSEVVKNLKRRHFAEKVFKFYGIIAITISFAFLLLLIISIFIRGYPAFWQTRILIPIEVHDPENIQEHNLLEHGFRSLIDNNIPLSQQDIYTIISSKALHELKDYLAKHQGEQDFSLWLLASSDTDMVIKQKLADNILDSQNLYLFNHNQLRIIEQLFRQGKIKKQLSWNILTAKDSRNPEHAGMIGSIAGSLITIIICVMLTFPLGIMTALYLHEIAPKNKFTELIEVNINNLASVPSIIFGLLGLAFFIGIFGVPRSSALVGGMTLSLMILPTIVITTLNSLKAVPPSIKAASLALGASPMQTMLHHTLPLAMPGIMTGTILGIARAIGETAPLIMIGMVAFIVDIPYSIFSPSTAMPVQIYLWSDSPELGFIERTSAGILILIFVLIILNIIAIIIRNRYERRW